jgi:hypothetical protein
VVRYALCESDKQFAFREGELEVRIIMCKSKREHSFLRATIFLIEPYVGRVLQTAHLPIVGLAAGSACFSLGVFFGSADPGSTVTRNFSVDNPAGDPATPGELRLGSLPAPPMGGFYGLPSGGIK